MTNAARVAILNLEDSDTLDSTALDALVECEQRLERAGCTLILARVKQDILEALRCSGPGGVSLHSRCFFSVADAFDGAQRAQPDWIETIGAARRRRALPRSRSTAEQDLVDARDKPISAARPSFCSPTRGRACPPGVLRPTRRRASAPRFSDAKEN